MARAQLVTWKDLVDHLVDWCGADPGQEVRRDGRKATLSALRDLASGHNWAYYYDRHRVTTVAPYSTGTVEYDHTGGSSERLLTLTAGTWPTWASQGTVVIDNVPYEADQRVSSSLLTLTAASNPGADVAAGTSFEIYQDTYSLPCGFHAMGSVVILQHAVVLCRDHPSTWLERQRVYQSQATPRTYTVRGSPNFMNALAVSFFPPPDQAYQVDMVYQRRPRDLKILEYSAGKASTSSSSATLTGTGTSWNSSMVGSVVRVSPTVGETPTSPAGPNPAQFERVVTAVGSATSLTMDATVDAGLTGVGYAISDPVDVEVGSMLTALLRGCEAQMAQARHMKDRDRADADYQRSLILAREADSRSFREESAGGRRGWPVRMADMPISFD